MSIQQRSYELELLDGEGIPFEDILLNMRELNAINTLLGGHAITINGFKALIGDRKSISVCEIGCGGGDNLVAILQFCQKNSIDVQLIGIDLKQACLEVANNYPLLNGRATFICSDYKEVVFQTKPDIIFSSLFCHHFNEAQLVHQLQWMQTQSAIGFFINDLQRHWLAYAAIKMLTKIFSNSYLVKHDAPLSVRRGFLREEWTQIFNRAEINTFSIKWKWAFRFLIVCKNSIIQHD